MRRMKQNAILGNIGHFDNEIDMAGLETYPGVVRKNVKPQVDLWTFPEGEGGDAAREALPRSVRQIQDRLCTVGRTVTLGDPVVYRTGELSTDADADDSIAPEPDPSA